MSSEEKLLKNLGALCNMVRRITLGAGEITLKYFDGLEDMDVIAKSDDSPVTKADREAEVYIRAELEKITPNIPFMGEESVSLGTADKVKTAEYFWLVDPLDGTKEFISGGGEFTVNIALIHQGSPIMGVVYAPAKGELYAGYDDKAIKWMEDTDKEKSIHVRNVPNKGMVVVASKSHGSAEKLDKFLEHFKVEKLIKRGSSIKICAIAEGKADMYPRFGPTCEWDTGAADAVLRAAGGSVRNEQGELLRYGGSNPKFLNPEFIACSFDWFSEEDECA